MAQGVISHSIKWASLSEIGVKLITPITTMILARILTPEAFGVLAVCNMIVFFSEIIADAGFGKYIVQADFNDNQTLNKFASVAFWSHFTLSVSIWSIVILISNHLADFLGVPGKQMVLIVACFDLVLMSIISTQLGLIRRKFLYKKAFVARISTVLTAFCVTIPLALYTKSYWALIIGRVSADIVNAIALTLLSKWRPMLFYSFSILKEMFSFSFWSLCEGLAHWFIFWFDVFIVTQFYTTYYVGLYKNSMSIMLSFISMFTASMGPVLLSVLSRLKNDVSYYDIYMRITGLFIYVLMPICISIFFCRHFVTLILLGTKWYEAANIIGPWALMLGLNVFIYSFPAEIYKSKGVPKYLFYYQLTYLLIMFPICLYAAYFGFWTFVYVRVSCILILLTLFFIFNKHYLGWSPSWVISKLHKPLLSVLIFIAMSSLTLIWIENMYIKFGVCLVVFLAYLMICYKLFGSDIKESRKILNQKQIG